MHLLLPGRHHLLTNAQLEFLTLWTEGADAQVTALLWAVTSANHAGTRRNPLPAHRREAAIEGLAAELTVPSYVYLVDDIGTNPRFGDYLLKKIEVDSQGRFRLTPADTLVWAASPELDEQFARLGFRVLTEAGPPPWQVLDELVAVGLAGRSWRNAETFLRRVHRASRRLLLKYDFDDLILDLHRHPVGTADGDLTATRDYNVYVRAFDEGAERKFALIRDHVRPGRIVDIGCCTGSLLQQLSRDDRLRESDFYGIELARPLYAECLHRKEQGAFGSDHVFFYQANVAERALFRPGSIDTFTTFSLTHELESYQGRATLERFIELLREQLAVGGRWLNVDVVGPDDGDQEVYLWLESASGRTDDHLAEPEGRQELKAYLAGLSTLGRFYRFARDFRRHEGYQLPFREETLQGERYLVLRLRDACEFLSKKDYLDNWRSEMHETFCFWSFADWQAALARAGLAVGAGSRAFTNPWIVTHRYEGKARLFQRQGDALAPLPWPVTNMLLVAEKR
ncbi:MAG: hypothetical protein U0840_10270 [Gemmataceae bacterium]